MSGFGNCGLATVLLQVVGNGLLKDVQCCCRLVDFATCHFFIMSFLIPEVFSVVLSDMNATLLQLLLDIRACQRKARLLWSVVPYGLSCENEDHLEGKHTYLMNEDGGSTVLPDCCAHSKTWTTALCRNPFDFDWLSHNGSDAFAS